ncbi:MAG: glycosyltransferase [Anaerolineales bacterium]|nr:glycosyltransferase [Anaerolineales bacterium]MDW8162921.1 glycosyltransferase [Anaerolineales bacterium]
MGFNKWLEYFTIHRSGYFDAAYYLSQNDDVRLADIDPLWHFIVNGWKEGRNPSRKFDVQFYLDFYPDVKEASINPLYHYLKFGREEGRKPRPLPDHIWERAPRRSEVPSPLARLIGKCLLTSFDKSKVPIIHPASIAVSVIIPNYNGKKYLGDCILSLRRQDFPRDQLEIIVVDNASSDGSQEYVRSHFPEVKLVVSPRNLGFSGGCNLGISHSRGRYIVLLNNDTVVAPNWLSELVSAAEADEEIAIVGSKLLFRNRPEFIQNAGSYITELGDGGDIGFAQQDIGQYDFTREVMAACGASMLVKRELIEQIGGFDEDFGSYYEDTDLCYRARLAGKKVLFAHKSVVYHVHAATLGEWSDQFSFFVFRNKLFLHLKNSPLPFFLRILLSYLRQVVDEVFRGYNRRTHLKVLYSFLTKLPSFIVKRLYVRSLLKTEDDQDVLLRFTKTKPKIRSSSIRKICIYNAYLPTFGGGETQTAFLVKSLSKLFPSASIEVLVHETIAFPVISIEELTRTLRGEYNLENTRVSLRYVPLRLSPRARFSLVEKVCRFLREEKIALLSRKYDLFINNTFASELPARGKLNIYYCMFPTKIEIPKGLRGYLYRFKKSRFLRSYHLFLANSNYTQRWIDNYWRVNSFVLYPPIGEIAGSPTLAKENLIVSVGRFFSGNHSKKQDILIKAFIEMYEKGWARGWELALIGRKHTDKESQTFLQSLYSLSHGYPIRILHDLRKDELVLYLKKAKIYWHATGYGENLKLAPEKFEHFGLSTIEAMQYGVVPVVYNAGGQPEIVKHGTNGFVYTTIEELIQLTKSLMQSNSLWARYSQAARDSTRNFREEVIERQLRSLLEQFIDWV